MKNTILVTIGLLIVAYAIGAFSQANLDITEWNPHVRINCAIGATVCVLLWVIFRILYPNRNV